MTITNEQLEALRALAHPVMPDAKLYRHPDGVRVIIRSMAFPEDSKRATVPETLRLIARAMDNRGTPGA